MTDRLFVACVTFFIIDLAFVGTTTLAVIMMTIYVLTHKNLLEEVEKLLKDNKKKKYNRNFIERGI